MKTHRLPLLLIFLFTLTAIGCVRNTVVPLSYPVSQGQTSQPNAIRVCVVDFANKRDTGDIGNLKDGTPLLPRTLVDRWLSTSLAEELRRSGYQATVVETLADALSKKPDFIVAGDAEEVRLVENSISRYTGTIRANVFLLDGNGKYITKNSYSSIYSKTVLPLYGVPKNLLDEALEEMLQPALQHLEKSMR